MERAYRICTRCVLDTSDPEIQFDDEGHCNHCRRYEWRVQHDLHYDERGQVLLERLLEDVRRRGRAREYDVVIGVSGGMDSTCVAHTVKKKLGLRPLAVHLDNGWNSETAVSNIKKTLDALEIDLYTHVIDWDEFRDLQLSFLKSSFINAEIPTDHAIVALLFRIAAEHGVGFIFGGSNIVTEGINVPSWVYDYKDWRLIRGIHREFGSASLSTYPHLSLARMVYLTFVRRIKFVPILNFVEYDREATRRLVETELGWRGYGGKHHESIYTRFYQAYILPKKFGVDKRRAHLSTLIMSGSLSRGAALEQLRQPACDPAQLQSDLDFVVKKLGVTTEEFDRMMSSPPRSFREFPNSHRFRSMLAPLASAAKRHLTYNKR